MMHRTPGREVKKGRFSSLVRRGDMSNNYHSENYMKLAPKKSMFICGKNLFQHGHSVMSQ